MAGEAEGFYTDNGTVRPITGRKGRGGAFVAAAVLAGAVAASGGGLGGGAVATGGMADTAVGGVDSAVTRSIRSRTSAGRNAAQKGQHDEAWRRMGLGRTTARVVRRAATCAAHSFGQVQEFFLRTPCRSLQRALFAVPDTRGGTIAVAVAWVRMRKSRDAVRLRALVDTYGTGNVTPLAGTALGLSGVRFAGKYYDSRRDGSLVVIAEAAPAGGRPDPELMKGVAQVAAEFPPP
ncbi:MAG TPA: hypothetical protein VIL00_03500 [Pseudonocardiaceae bacterium]